MLRSYIKPSKGGRGKHIYLKIFHSVKRFVSEVIYQHWINLSWSSLFFRVFYLSYDKIRVELLKDDNVTFKLMIWQTSSGSQTQDIGFFVISIENSSNQPEVFELKEKTLEFSNSTFLYSFIYIPPSLLPHLSYEQLRQLVSFQQLVYFNTRIFSASANLLKRRTVSSVKIILISILSTTSSLETLHLLKSQQPLTTLPLWSSNSSAAQLRQWNSIWDWRGNLSYLPRWYFQWTRGQAEAIMLWFVESSVFEFPIFRSNGSRIG